MGVWDSARNAFSGSAPYGPARRSASQESTPRNNGDLTPASLQAIAQLLKDEIGPVQNELRAMKGTLNQQQQATSDLNTRMDGLNTRVGTLEQHLTATVNTQAAAAVQSSMAQIGADYKTLEAAVANLQQGGATAAVSKPKSSTRMSPGEQIREICDKIELRFTGGEAEPATADEAKQMIEQVLGSLMTS